MSNKANKDGVDFQQHLYFHLIGLYHQLKDRGYSILYEGDDSIYGAWDDVIVKEKGSMPGLFFFQAKQVQNSIKVMSLDDVFDMKKGIVKYLQSYDLYLESPQFRKDGAPNEVIYWTSQGIHESTKRVLRPCQDTRLPLQSLGPISNMYQIEDWKTLVLFDIAWKWAVICNPKAESKHGAEYICNAVANGLAGEILEADKDGKVRFREAFLLGDPEYFASASNQVQTFREQFQLACPLQQRKNQLDLKQFKDNTFEEKLFGLQKDWSNIRADSVQFEHRYQHNKKTRILDEEKLEQFFQAFRYYTNVPKGEDMVKILDRLFDDNFDEKLFEQYLIPKQISNKKVQHDRYINRNQVNSVIELIKLKKQYTAQEISGVSFTIESSLQLRKCFKEYVDQKEEDRLLNIVAPYALDWTAYRVQKELRNISTCIVIMEKDVPLVNDKLSLILETHIASEIGTIIVTGVNSFVKQDLTNLRQKVKRIILISSRPIANVSVFHDELLDNHVLIDLKQVGPLKMKIDDRTVPLHIVKEQFTSVHKCAELYNVKSPIVVKSELYESKSDQRYTLVDDQQKEITNEQLKDRMHNRVTSADQQKEITNEQLKDRMQNRVTVIVGPVGQGKTIQLLQIASYLNQGDALCVLFTARTIAKHFKRASPKSSVSFNGWDDFVKLLTISPSSDIAKRLVVQYLAQNNQLYILVDGLDELVDSCQDDVISLIQKLIGLTQLEVIIGASMELKTKLEKLFNQADFYYLNQSSTPDFLKELSLNKGISVDLVDDSIRQDVNSLLYAMGFAEFCSHPLMSRISNNCGIGSLYNSLIVCCLDLSFKSLDINLRIHAELIKHNTSRFYDIHELLAYDHLRGIRQDDQKYETIMQYGLVRRNSTSGDRSKSDLEFIYASIRYFFLVRHILTAAYIEATYFNKFMNQYLCMPKAVIVALFVDYFLDTYEYLCQPFRAKMRRFMEKNPQQLVIYVQFTLNNKSFNTLELLLSEAPIRAVKNLEFRCMGIMASKNQNVSMCFNQNVVHLEKNQLWYLLKKLRKNDPTSEDSRITQLLLKIHGQSEKHLDDELKQLLNETDVVRKDDDDENARLFDECIRLFYENELDDISLFIHDITPISCRICINYKPLNFSDNTILKALAFGNLVVFAVLILMNIYSEISFWKIHESGPSVAYALIIIFVASVVLVMYFIFLREKHLASNKIFSRFVEISIRDVNELTPSYKISKGLFPPNVNQPSKKPQRRKDLSSIKTD